jgi:hypothetical protein
MVLNLLKNETLAGWAEDNIYVFVVVSNHFNHFKSGGLLLQDAFSVRIHGNKFVTVLVERKIPRLSVTPTVKDRVCADRI